jgi:molecular chaperone GrpE
MLADFRAWLLDLTEPPPAPERVPPAVDLATVVAQFTALRHDVNLQTKAVRAATEQTAEVVAKLPAPAPKADAPPDVKPLLKAVIDIADALLTAHRQVGKAMDAVEPLANELDDVPTAPLVEVSEPTQPGFFARLFGAKPAPVVVHQQTPPPQAATKLAPLLAGLADGYALSLRRVEKVLPQYGLTPIECVGQPFDPELMEVVEAVGGTGKPGGTVVEEVRRGYRLNGTIHRFAQVKVAR